MARDLLVRAVALAVALLLVTTTAGIGAFVGGVSAVGGGVVAADAESPADPTAGDDREVVPPTQCFAGDGYPVSIGDTGATMDALVHLSVLTDPAVGNEFGMEAAGALDGDPIVTLAAGVRLTAREAIADGIDPFAAFDVLYTYELRLPMFDGSIGDTEYRDDGSPIDSGAGTVPC